MFRKLTHSKIELGLIAAIVLLVIARVAALPFSPPGFYLDEAAGAAHIASMVHHGTNAFGQSWPLFSSALGGGYTTPIYLYPATIWAMLFGLSEISLRYFSEVCTLLAVLFMALSMRLWIGMRVGLIVACTGLALPWGWLQGSLAWDPALVPLVVSIAFAAFSQLLFTKSRYTKIAMLMLLPVALIALAYLYPPARVTAPLLFIASYSVLYAKHIIDVRQIFVTIITSAVLALPLLQFMSGPESLNRSQSLIVFHDESVVSGLLQMISNFGQMLSPWFLFIDGDHNLRHSTGFQGMLGMAAIPAIIGLILLIIKSKSFKKLNHKLLLSIVVFGIFASLLGSALTNEGQPHSLRAVAAWPFIIVLLAIGWQWIFSLKNKFVTTLAALIFVVSTSAYIYDFVAAYPARSGESFDQSIHEKIIHGEKVSDYPDLSQKYYQIR